MMSEYCSDGFPHSEIHGSMDAFSLPWLIADRCVLRRLLVPRHSPCALCSLTIVSNLVLSTRRKLLVISLPLNLPCFSHYYSISSLFSFQGAFFRFAQVKSEELKVKSFGRASPLPIFFFFLLPLSSAFV